jgi:hypothetical protein
MKDDDEDMDDEEQDNEQEEIEEDEGDDEPKMLDLDFLKPGNKHGKKRSMLAMDSNINIAFLESENALDQTHKVGSYYFFKVMKVQYINASDQFDVSVSLNPENSILPIHDLDFKFLKPGFLFKTEVTRELLNGSEVAFGGNIGGIFIDHMKKGATALSRVIHVGANYISLSSLKHITNLYIPEVEKKLALQGRLFENIPVDKKSFRKLIPVNNRKYKMLLTSNPNKRNQVRGS